MVLVKNIQQYKAQFPPFVIDKIQDYFQTFSRAKYQNFRHEFVAKWTIILLHDPEFLTLNKLFICLFLLF